MRVRFVDRRNQCAGKLDRLDQIGDSEVVIVDYKTGKPKTQDDADDSLQLSIYALAARHMGFTASSLVFTTGELHRRASIMLGKATSQHRRQGD